MRKRLKVEARLLFEAGNASMRIKNYLVPQGTSRAFRENRPFELKCALTNYSQERIQTYLDVLEKHGLAKEAERLGENYIRLEELAKNYQDPIGHEAPHAMGFAGKMKTF